MRNERSEPKKIKHTKVLFKKSDLTIGPSSIYSDVSQRGFKSAINRIRNDLHRHDYYTHKGKLKRDLSLETKNCVLRRICKRKLASLTSSAKSKYSNYNEAGTIEEYEESSGSGDNKKSIEEDNCNSFNSDVTVLMENLRNLLNVWVRKNLTDDNVAKHKFNNVLDSILDKLHIDETKDSSRTTYVLGKGSTTCSGVCQVCKKKRKPVSSTKLKKLPKRKSYHASRKDPYQCISSLSVPKYFCKNNIRTIFPKDQKSKSLKIDSTVTEELSATTVNCDILPETYYIKQSNFRMLKLFPKLYKCSMESKLKTDSNKMLNINMSQFDNLPSLVKIMYASNLVNIASTDADLIEDNNKEVKAKTDSKNCEVTMHSRTAFTMISKQCVIDKNAGILSDSVKKSVTERSLETVDNNLESAALTPITISNNENLIPRKHDNNNVKRKRHSKSKESRKPIKHRSNTNKYARKRPRKIYSKRLPRLHVADQILNNHSKTDFVGHLKKIIKCFFENNGSNNIKFDINISLSPLIDQEIKEKNNKERDKDVNKINTTNENKVEINTPNIEGEIHSPPSLSVYASNTSERYPAIIPLLDGAASRAKYILDSKNSTVEESDLSLNNNNEVNNNNVSCKDIIEIKAMVKDISKRTKKLVYEHFKRQIDTHKTQTVISDTNFEYCLPTASNPSPAEIEITKSTSPRITNIKKIYVSDKNIEVSMMPIDFSVEKNRNENVHDHLWALNDEEQLQTHLNETNLEVNLSGIPNDIKNISTKVSPLPHFLDTEKPLNVETRSKGIQVSRALSRTTVTGFSGLKVTKEPRKSDSPNKNIKKSVSYDIIESESLVKVTDMTVTEQTNVQSEIESPTPTLKTESLANVEVNNQIPKVLTFYCDKCSGKCEFLYDNHKPGDTSCQSDGLSKTASKNDGPCGDNVKLEENKISCETDIEKSELNVMKCKPNCQKITIYCLVVLITVIGVASAVYIYFINGNINIKTGSKFEESLISEIPVKSKYFPIKHQKHSKTPGIRWFSSELGF
ncbi:uncharacterized protein LOC128681070 isoform X1 [Plodia interpunctella]|uniref:uncharacterized protein LOC128681070 isoform X1 n=1 Tax=Plodia interpunctella TaxID=58824 RepID=UPI002367BFD3|nr:uncharacterized protein LOC128681070 isoform X2 [Plodia interpunctella]